MYLISKIDKVIKFEAHKLIKFDTDDDSKYCCKVSSTNTFWYKNLYKYKI